MYSNKSGKRQQSPAFKKGAQPKNITSSNNNNLQVPTVGSSNKNMFTASSEKTNKSNSNQFSKATTDNSTKNINIDSNRMPSPSNNNKLSPSNNNQNNIQMSKLSTTNTIDSKFENNLQAQNSFKDSPNKASPNNTTNNTPANLNTNTTSTSVKTNTSRSKNETDTRTFAERKAAFQNMQKEKNIMLNKAIASTINKKKPLCCDMNTYLFTGTGQGTVSQYCVKHKKLVKKYEASDCHDGAVESLLFSNNLKTMFTAGTDKTLKQWD